MLRNLSLALRKQKKAGDDRTTAGRIPKSSLNPEVIRALSLKVINTREYEIYSLLRRILAPARYIPYKEERSLPPCSQELSVAVVNQAEQLGICIGLSLVQQNSEVCATASQDPIVTTIKDFLAATFTNTLPDEWAGKVVESCKGSLKDFNLIGRQMMTMSDYQNFWYPMASRVIPDPDEVAVNLLPLVSAAEISDAQLVELKRTWQNALQTPGIAEYVFLIECLAFSHMSIAKTLKEALAPVLFTTAYAFSKTENSREATWERRHGTLEQAFPNMGSIAGGFLKSNKMAADQLSGIFKKLAKEGVNLRAVADALREMVDPYVEDIPFIAAMIDQSEGKGMTVIQLIRRTVTEFPNIGWIQLARVTPVLAGEFNLFLQYLVATAEQPYAGFSTTGIAPAVPNLAYFCVKILTKLGGDKNLTFYRGVGSETSTVTVPLRTRIDAFVDTVMKSDQASLASVLSTSEWEEEHEKHREKYDILNAILAGKHGRPAIEDEDEVDAPLPDFYHLFRDEKDDKGDDDDPGHGPGGSGPGGPGGRRPPEDQDRRGGNDDDDHPPRRPATSSSSHSTGRSEMKRRRVETPEARAGSSREKESHPPEKKAKPTPASKQTGSRSAGLGTSARSPPADSRTEEPLPPRTPRNTRAKKRL